MALLQFTLPDDGQAIKTLQFTPCDDGLPDFSKPVMFVSSLGTFEYPVGSVRDTLQHSLVMQHRREVAERDYFVAMLDDGSEAGK